MSDDNNKAYSAWPMPAPTGKCHVRILVQDSRGLTSETVMPCLNWEHAEKVQHALRALLDWPTRGTTE